MNTGDQTMRRSWALWPILALLAMPAGAEAPDDTTAEPVPLEELRLFAEVFSRIKKHYVDEVDDRQLLEDAIHGMLDGLDPHSAFLSSSEFDDLREDTRGEFGGLGMEVGMEDGFVKVIAPIDDTPAQKAGVKAGDYIIRLDGKPLKGLSLNEAVEMMRGKPGSTVKLTIMREGAEKPLNITVRRAVIRVKSVKVRLLDRDYGYVRIASFQERTADDLLRAIRRLQRKADDGLKGVVLDLRNNPGGVLDAAVAVSDAFLDRGRVVSASGRTDESQLEFDAQPGDVLEGAPMVVLVDEGSASASEIVAGALQDHQRAVIMGRLTFGKGSVQTIVPIGRQAAIKITTARYYTPSGRSIQASGIEPDIALAPVKVELTDSSQDTVRESQLEGHLANDAAGEATGEEDAAGLVTEDYALAEALNLLKGLAILKRP
jgi:carboxyl-terminal processing protease